jgi:hypothetical protein
MRVYLAAQYSQKPKIAVCKQDLLALGITVTSTWTDESEDPNLSLRDVTDGRLLEYAYRDIDEIITSDVLVLFTVDPDEKTRRGGRHFESGLAFGLRKTLVLIGPRENIFHHLISPDLIFPTWDSFLERVLSWQTE